METTTPDEFFPAPATRNVIFWDFCTMARESELFIRNRAFSELVYWHTLATPLDTLTAQQRFVSRGEMIVRYDTEIARLRALDNIGKLAHMDRARLDYLEDITSSVIAMSDDIKWFADEIKQAIKDSSH